MERAARAETLLRDEMLTEAFETLKADYATAWRNTGLRDTEARERLWQATNLVDKVGDHLKKVMADGRLAHRELSEMQGRHGQFKED